MQCSGSLSASLEFWSTFCNSLAENTTGTEFHNARLVDDALMEAFPNGLPELETCALRGQVVRGGIDSELALVWSELLPVKVVQFASLHNSSVIKMEEVDCKEGAIVDYAVTFDNLGRKRFWPMADLRVCPCGGNI